MATYEWHPMTWGATCARPYAVVNSGVATGYPAGAGAAGTAATAAAATGGSFWG